MCYSHLVERIRKLNEKEHQINPCLHLDAGRDVLTRWPRRRRCAVCSKSCAINAPMSFLKASRSSCGSLNRLGITSGAASETRGRPRRWPRDDVALVSRKLKAVLRRETGGRVSMPSFVSLYLPILRYPSEITAELVQEEINIKEASINERLHRASGGSSIAQDSRRS